MGENTLFDVVVFYLVVISTVLLLVNTVRVVLYKIFSNLLTRSLYEKNEEKFEKTYKRFGHFFVNKGEYEEIRFDVYSMHGNRNKQEEVVEETKNSKISRIQKKRLYPKFFYYYLDAKKFDKAKEMYEILQTIGLYKGKKELDLYYEAFILNSHKSLEKCEEEVKKASGSKLVDLEKILSKMYENKGINAEAKKYARLAEKHERELHK